MKITIENNTHWSTRDLRRFVVRCVRDRLTDDYRARWRTMKFRFGHYTRRTWITKLPADDLCSGHAYVGGNFVHISVPKHAVDRVDLAHTIGHEIGHCLGMSHRDMTGGALWYRVGNWRDIYGWAAALPLGRQTERPKPTRAEKRDRKRLGMEARLRAWRTKRKRAENAIRKLERALKRLDKSTTTGVDPCK